MSTLFNSESHSKGLTCISYDEESNYIITGAVDGEIKIWSGLTNNLVLNYTLSSGINSVVYEKERIFSASANKIEIHSTIAKNKTTILCQFASNVNYIYINQYKTKLVACSDDHSVKLINLESSVDTTQGNKREISFEGHEAPVISVASNRNCDLIASSSCDGSIIVWDVQKKSVLKSLVVLKKFKDISQVDNLCRVKWHPTEPKILLVPLNDEIENIDCTRFTKLTRPSYIWSSVTSGMLTELAFSIDGQFLAAGTVDGYLVIWETDSAEIVASWRSTRRARVTGLAWQCGPSNTTLLFVDSSGVWEAVQFNLSRPSKKDKKKSLTDEDMVTMEELDELIDSAAWEDNDEHGGVPGIDFEAKEDGINSDDDINSDDAESQADTEELSDDDGENNFPDVSISDIKKQFLSPIKAEAAESVVGTTKIVHVHREPHPVVRSTSCPRNGNLQLLLWNPIAVLKQHYQEDGFLEVEFLDSEVHQNLVFRHALGHYTMGDVNRSALVLVSNCDSDSDREAASVLVRPLNATWREWHLTLPTLEEPVACALLGEEFVLVLTEQFLRYFHVPTGGIQMHIDSLPGTPVAIASSMNPISRVHDQTERHRVVVVVDDGVKLVWRIEEVAPAPWMVNGVFVGSRISDWHPLPLSRDATLFWIGFSDSNNLYTVDSEQCVRRLHMDLLPGGVSFGVPRWSPVLDFRLVNNNSKSKSVDRYFPIGFLDQQEPSLGAMAVRCAPGGSRYPSLVPLPHMAIVPFSMPMCASPADSEATQHEQTLMLNQLVPDWSANRESLQLAEKQSLLKLFASAVSHDDNSRAFQIARLMPDVQLVQLAIQYAARNNRRGLAQKLGELALLREEEGDRRAQSAVATSHQESCASDGPDDSASGQSDRENEDAPSDHKEARPGERVRAEVAAALLREHPGNGALPSATPSHSAAAPAQSPFPVVRRVAPAARKGVSVLDEVVATAAAASALSDKRQRQPAAHAASAVFGTFSPALDSSNKTFRLSAAGKKRKQPASTAKMANSPLAKALKK